jgi:hypothetical protein
MANASRTTKAGRDVAIVTALRTGVLGLDQISLGTKVYTQSGAADLVQGRIDAGAALLQAKAAWEAAIASYEAIDKQVDIAVRDLRNTVIARCGENSLEMAAFQFEARKKRVFTQEQITAIVAKRNATRERNGTKGRKQKKGIKGVVPAAAVVPVPDVATTAPSAASPAATTGEPVEGNASPPAAPTPDEPGNKSG